MKPTVEYIQERFETFNKQYFEGMLPPIPIRLSHAKGFLGKVTFTKRRQGLFGRYRNTDFVLRINVRIDLPEELIEDTILHEMIHYYIAVNQWTDSSSHGALFRREMARINHEGNRHISISHRLSETEQQQAVVKKGRVVAVVRFEDGKQGVKVVPKQIRHIMAWDRNVRRHFFIRSIDWYYTDDPAFARYPSSVAFRIYLCNEEEPLPLSNAHRLAVSGHQVRLQLHPANPLRW